MRKYIALAALIIIAVSCKAKKATFSSEADASASAKDIIRNYNLQSDLDFEILHIRGNTSVSIFNINLDIRIKKDEIILISARAPLIGNVAKAFITPDYVSYYYKPDSEYFEGDYEFLSNWLGMELDFQKVQNLLLGRTLDDLSRERLVVEIENNLYKLSSNRKGLDKAYFFEPDNFRLVSQIVEQKYESRNASIVYYNYKTQNNNTLPFSFLINSLTKKDKNEFKVEYKTIEFNPQISFPYSIPQGYREVKIN